MTYAMNPPGFDDDDDVVVVVVVVVVVAAAVLGDLLHLLPDACEE